MDSEKRRNFCRAKICATFPCLRALPLALHMKTTESFIEDRIRWRAGLHGLPKQNTYFWENGKKTPQIVLPVRIGKPVLVSAANDLEFIVLCTRGAAVKNYGVESSFLYDEIDEVRDVPMAHGEEKADLTKLVIKLINGDEVPVSPEPFGPAFSVWNILIMLQRMS